MLFVFDPSLGNYAFQGNVVQEVISGLDMLALGFREGRHIIAASPATLNLLMKLQTLQPLTRVALRTARDRFSELMGLPGRFSTYVNVVPHNAGSITRTSVGGRTIIEIPIGHFSHSARIQNTILLTEHLVDATIAKLMARVYQTDTNLLSIPIHPDSRCGGGSNIGVTLTQVAKEKDRFCIVLVDSDKKSPDGPVGDTLRCVRKAYTNTGPFPLIELCVLDCKEMENALPDIFFEAAYGHDLNHRKTAAFLKRLSKNGAEDVRDFVDIKEGLSVAAVFKMEQRSPDFQFWHSRLNQLATYSDLSSQHDPGCAKGENCLNPANCCCWFLKGNNTDILATAGETMAQWRPNQWAALTGHRRNIWRKVGQVVFEWSSGWAFSAA